jgi:hypothetical protein
MVGQRSMSPDHVHQILDRALNDAAFRDLLARDPESALVGYQLSDEERARFRTGTAKVERLEERVSKNDLSAAFAIKTGGVVLRPPSESMKKGPAR